MCNKKNVEKHEKRKTIWVTCVLVFLLFAELTGLYLSLFDSEGWILIRIPLGIFCSLAALVTLDFLCRCACCLGVDIRTKYFVLTSHGLPDKGDFYFAIGNIKTSKDGKPIYPVIVESETEFDQDDADAFSEENQEVEQVDIKESVDEPIDK